MSGRTRHVLVALAATLGLSSCGLPGNDSIRAVDDGDVPYRLLEPVTSPSPTGNVASARLNAPVVFWVDGDRLLPTASGADCSEEPAVLVARLLGTLAGGPSEEARAAGRSSAVPADFALELAGVDGGTATVDIQPQTSLSAEQLPVAVGQIVLTVASVPSVRSVALTSDGAPLQVPLPEGSLTEGPVRARDYVELLPPRLRAPGVLGCPRG